MAEMALSLPDPPITINPQCDESIGHLLNSVGLSLGTATSVTWNSANKAQFYPVWISKSTLWLRAFYHTGAALSGNFDIGIYSYQGQRLWSQGTTLQSGGVINTIRDLSINTGSGVRLEPGLHFMALVLSDTTGTVFARTPSPQIYAGTGVLSQALGSNVLPATATFAVASSGMAPVFGFSQRSFV